MAGDRIELTDDAKRAHDEALSHADDLLGAAEQIVERYPHLAFHFGVLALEEVGRATLIVMSEVADRREGGERRFERAMDDHVRKLFWALWGPSFGRELITVEQVEERRGLARSLHDTRLAGLYYAGPHATPPREAIDKTAARQVIGLARSGLELERAHEWVEPDSEQAADLSWFIDASDDVERRNDITSGASMRKLTELGSVPKWIRWLREQFQAAEEAARDLVERELARPKPTAVDRAEPKWQMKVRLESASHSIRPGPLRWWNELGAWIKLYPVASDRSLLTADFTLPMAISVHALWLAGLSATHQLLLALNIGSMGFFWWHMSDKVSRFYNELTDLETGERLFVERVPALRVDWGHHALTQNILGNVALSFHGLPARRDTGRHAPFDYYLTGLAFMAKTDVTIQFEANAFEQFYRALKAASELYGTWDGVSPFVEHFEDLADPYFEEAADRNAFLSAASDIERGTMRELRVDLAKVAALKLLTDATLLRQFRAQASAEAEATEDQSED